MARTFLPVHRGVPQAAVFSHGPAAEGPMAVPGGRQPAPEPTGKTGEPRVSESPFALAPLFSPSGGGVPPLQTKLTIGAPRDRHEQEADRVAANVVDFLHAPPVTPTAQETVQRQEIPEHPEIPEAEGERPAISAARGSGEELLQGCDGCGGTCGTEELETQVQRARREGGEPLPSSVRQPMESAFGTDFGDVTIHRDRPADQLNHTLEARAFATGRDIFFRHGEYAPATRGGQELLAHELTHVVQQGGGELRRSPAENHAVLQRACTRAQCGGDLDPDPDLPAEPVEIEEDHPPEQDHAAEQDHAMGEEDDHPINLKPLAGRSNPFLGAAAVPLPTEHLVVQRAATVTGALDNTAARDKNLGAGGVFGAPVFGGVTGNNTATSMEASWLHQQPFGTGVNGKRPDDWKVFKKLAANRNPFCQGHFLSQKLGGAGAHENLSPFTRSLNGLHEDRVESKLIDWTQWAGQDKWAHYKVSATYTGNDKVKDWALGEYNGMSDAKRKAAADTIPFQGPFASAAKADLAAHPWIENYVNDTFPTYIECSVKFIHQTGASFRANKAWQHVKITNEF